MNWEEEIMSEDVDFWKQAEATTAILAPHKKFDGAISIERGMFVEENYKKFVIDKEVKN